MVTNTTSAASSFSSWQAARDQGKAEFQQGNYDRALESFRAALAMQQSGSVDRQLLLSNMVACRLQLGGAAQARAAVADAQQCIALNPSWAKGHVRLASAYAVLGQSNDACNSLQKALRLDPGNQVARRMLVQELGRDRHANRTNSRNHLDNDDDNEEEQQPPPPAVNPAYQEEAPGARRDEPYPPAAAAGAAPQDQPYPRPPQPQRRPRNTAVNLDDDYISLTDRVRFHCQKWTNWYYGLSEDLRTALHVVVGLLVLYVAFGGRFGLFESSAEPTSSRHNMKGNYGADNAYEQYHRQQQQRRRDSAYSPRGGGGGGGDDYYANSWGYSAGGGGGNTDSFVGNGSGDGFFLYMALTAAGVYVAHLMGISPWQILFLFNMLGRRQRGFGGRRGGGGMMYGGGGRFGGRRYGRRW